MKLPSLQMLGGEFTTSSALLDKAKHIGIGRPEKDPELLVFGAAATKFQGDYALAINAPGTTFKSKAWTYQFYAKIEGSVPVLASNLFGDGSGEFLFRISSSWIYAFISAKNGDRRDIYDAGYTEIPKELRGGYRHYKITSDGSSVLFWIDGVKVRTMRYAVNPPSNGLTFMGRQWGASGALVEGAKAHIELIRFDWEYIVPNQENFVFKNQVNLDVARSFFDEDAVESHNFEILRLTDIFNYQPTASPADIDAAPKVVPVMTGDVANGFTVTYDSVWSGTYSGWKAFTAFPTSDASIAWLSGNVAPTIANPHWLKIAATKRMRFNAYRITDRVGSSGRFVSWELQGRNTGDVGWNIIHAVTDDLSTSNIRYYSDFAVAEYDEVRIVITKNTAAYTAGMAVYSAIGNLQFMLVTGGAGKKALRYSDGDYVITDTPTKATVGNHIANVKRVPVKGIKFDRYEVCNRTWPTGTSVQSPTTWVLQGRNSDGDTWTDIDTVTGRSNNASGAITSHQLATPAQFKQVRMYITGTAGTNPFTSIGELKLFLNDVWLTPAMSGDVEGLYSVTTSSHYTVSGPFPGWMAFNHIQDGGWVTSSKASSASPQWIQLTADQEEVEIVVETSDGQSLIAGPVNDRSPLWNYVQGNGYLVDDQGTKKFSPFSLTGLTEIVIDGITYLIYQTSTLIPMSGKAVSVIEAKAAQGAAYNLALTANSWKVMGMTSAIIDGVPIEITAGKFILPRGKYYGKLNLPAFKCNGFVARVRAEDGTTLANTPGGFASNGIAGTGTIKAKLFFEVLLDTVIWVEAFAEAANVASTTAAASVAAPMTLASLNLFKVG